jgi:hypothetical protein
MIRAVLPQVLEQLPIFGSIASRGRPLNFCNVAIALTAPTVLFPNFLEYLLLEAALDVR